MRLLSLHREAIWGTFMERLDEQITSREKAIDHERHRPEGNQYSSRSYNQLESKSSLPRLQRWMDEQAREPACKTSYGRLDARKDGHSHSSNTCRFTCYF